MGYADMLREGMAGPLNTRQRDYLDHMRQSSDQLRSLIDDILDLASIDAGAMELDLAEVDVKEMLESVAEAAHDQLEEAECGSPWRFPVPMPAPLPPIQAVRGRSCSTSLPMPSPPRPRAAP